MSKVIQSIRGMNDILPDETPYWQFLENAVRETLSSYGYEEIRFPIVEHTELFKRSIGEVTDIVEKEMYSFGGKDNLKYSLRPEGTAACVRAGISNGLFYNQTQKLWYMGPMFRRENPQEGRYRQFHQIGVEAFGFNGPDVDAEIILMSARLWKNLGLTPKLEINSIGSTDTRKTYKKALVDYFTPIKSELDPDSQRRLLKNPLRILDSKDPNTQSLVKDAPILPDFLSDDEQQHFSQFRELLDDAGVQYTVNHKLVRGLDYYNNTVFEWISDKKGAQNAICSGGRYDGLTEQLGGKPSKAVGWALGIERVISLLKKADLSIKSHRADVYFIVDKGQETKRQAFTISESLRNSLNKVKLTVNCGDGSFKSQMKKADKSGARYALILGQDELSNNQVSLKNLRQREPQELINIDNLAEKLAELLAV